VLLTLWDAYDMSTADFMGSFYRHLLATSNKAQSLQKAMGEVRERYPHPFYWAPFILIDRRIQAENGPRLYFSGVRYP
jgi:CHAT domain-containing protein